jgi:hypothetical protein
MNKEEQIILRKPENWVEWERTFKTRAISLKMWDVITDDTENYIPEPEMPDFEGLSQAASSFQLTLYNTRDKKYTKQQDAERDLKMWMESTVEKGLRGTTFIPEQRVHEWFNNLKANLDVQVADVKHTIRERYLEHTRPGKPVTDLGQWILQWQQLINLGANNKVAGPDDPVAWFSDLMKVVEHWDQVWASTFRLICEQKVRSERMDLRAVAAQLGRQFEGKKLAVKGSRIQRGAFLGFAGKPAQGKEEKEGGSGGKATHKRGYSGGENSGCWACGQAHKLAKCFYVFPEQKPEHFTLREETQQKVDEKLQEDSQLREQVEKLKGKKPYRGKRREKKPEKEKED